MESQEEPSLDLDHILPKIGEFGRYQKMILYLICLPACIPCAMVAFNQLFMTDVPEHWCNVPELNFLSPGERKNLSIPLNVQNNFDSCRRYKANWTKILESNLVPNNTWETEKCIDGYEFNTTIIDSSIVIDFDLVCDYAIYPTMSLCILNLASPLGVYIFGYLNDKYGRKKSYFICLFIFILGSILSCVAPIYWVWMLFRFIAGSTVPAVYQIPFILGLELVGPKYRSIVTLTSCIYYALGLMLLSGIAYLIRNWIYLTITTSVPFGLYFCFWYILPESPRWLLLKGDYCQAGKILEKIARVNKKKLPSGIQTILKEEIDIQEKIKDNSRTSPKMLSLCRTPNMRLKTILVIFNWFTNITTYVGLNYYGPALGSNRYLSFFLSSLVEIPSYFFVFVTMDTWGRRGPFSFTMILSGISSIATVLLPKESETSILVLFLIAKCAISASLALWYPFAGELFPTELRGLGLGTAAYVGGIGLIVIPFVTYLGNENLVIPLVIMGTMAILGGITSLRLPDTLNQPLPQTLEEAENFGKHWTYKQYCQCVQKNKL